MKTSTLAVALVLIVTAAGCDSPLQKEKNQASQTISEQYPGLLKKVPLEMLKVGTDGPGLVAVEVDGGTIFALRPARRQQNDRGTSLEYPEFHAQIVKLAGGKEFSALPPSWGSDDLDKLRFICGASQGTIDAVSDSGGLKEAVAILTARAAIAPPGAFDRLVWLESDRFVGLLSGDFSESAWMEILLRPARGAKANYLISFRGKDGGGYDHVLKFVRSLAFEPSAEQADADQPATGVDSNAEGKEKPKPESEGRTQ